MPETASSCAHRLASTRPQVRSADAGPLGRREEGTSITSQKLPRYRHRVPCPRPVSPKMLFSDHWEGGGPVQARRRGLMLQGRGEASRGTTAAPSSAPSAPSAWLSLTVPCPGLPGLAVVPTGPGLWFSSQPGTKPGPQAPPHPNHLSFLLICMSLRRLD